MDERLKTDDPLEDFDLDEENVELDDELDDLDDLELDDLDEEDGGIGLDDEDVAGG